MVDKAAEFKEIIEGLTAELAKIPIQYNEEEKVCIDLETKLEKLKKHEEELIQRVAELKEEQIDLKKKREKVLAVREFFLSFLLDALVKAFLEH